MDIVLSNTSDKPIYQQLFEQISAQIVKGELAADACLPPIRTVARELGVSVIPVKKAWEDLERAGFIYSMVGRGCFVAPLVASERSGKKESLAIDRLKKDVAFYKGLGLSLDELLELIRRSYEA